MDGKSFSKVIFPFPQCRLWNAFMIRPQQKRQKELVKFRNALEKGRKIITAGGIYGTIKEVKETYVLVEVDSNVAIRVDKNMVMKDPSDLAAQAK